MDSRGPLPAPRVPRPAPLALVLRVVVYLMLLLTAAATVVFGESLWVAARDGWVPPWAPLAAPALFTLFVVVYTLDRWFLVRHRAYPQSRALVQVAFALVFLTLLLEPQAQEMRQPRPPARQDAAALTLLGDDDEEVRAAACEILGGQLSVVVFDRVRVLSQHDPAANVRQSCERALGRLHTSGSGGRERGP